MRMLLLSAIFLLALPTAQAQVVQQPVFRNFSYSGGAWVPDAGTGSLGGTAYSRSSSNYGGMGPYSRRSSSTQKGGSSLTASVTIIDLDALDEAILNAPVSPDPVAPGVISPTGTNGGVTQTPPARLAGLGRTIITATEPHLHGISRVHSDDPNAYRRALQGHSLQPQNLTHETQVESDVRFYLSEGLKAEQADRIVAARVYYRMAMEAMTPEMIERYRKVVARKKLEAEQDQEKNRPGSIKF